MVWESAAEGAELLQPSALVPEGAWGHSRARDGRSKRQLL